MVKEPLEIQDEKKLDETKKSGKPAIGVGVIGALVFVMILEAVFLIIIMRGCEPKTPDIDIPSAVPTQGLKGDPVNPTIEVESRVCNLKPESMAEPVKNVNIGFSLEIANKEKEKELREEVAKIMPWINNILIEKMGNMAYSEAKEPETRKKLARDLLGEINNKLGASETGRAKIRELYWQTYHLY